MFSPWRRVALHRRVLVNLKTGAAIRGVLMGQRGSLLVLRDCEHCEPGGQALPMEGEVLIEVANVDFAQALSAREG